MKYVLYGFLILLAIVVILLIIAIIRAIIIKKEYIPATKVMGEVARKEEFARKLGDLIKCNTITYVNPEDADRFLHYHQVVKEMFPLIDKKLEKIEIEGYSFLYKWKGKNQTKKPILLIGHSDVVPITKDGWTKDPFSGDYDGERVHGRGALDNKSSFYAFMQAVEDLLKDGFVPEVDVYLGSASDEEIAGVGAVRIMKYLKERNVRLALVLDEGGAIITGVLPTLKAPFAVVGILEKGFANLEFVKTGIGGHASTPSKNTPLVQIAKFITEVEKKKPLKKKFIPEVQTMFECMAPYMSFSYRLLFANFWLFKPLLTRLLPAVSPYGAAILGTTFAFTMAEGSSAPNVIPTKAKVIVNIRTHPIQDITSSLKVFNKIASKYGITGTMIKGAEATKKVDMNSKGYLYLTEMIKRIFPDIGIAPYVITGRTDAREFEEISDCTIRFAPTRMTNEDLKGIHGINESVAINSVIEAIHFYKELLKNYQE